MTNNNLDLKEVQNILKGFNSDIVVNTVLNRWLTFQEVDDSDFEPLYINANMEFDNSISIKNLNINKKILKSILKIKNNDNISFIQDNEINIIKTETKEIKNSESNLLYSDKFDSMEFDLIEFLLIEDFEKSFQDNNIPKDNTRLMLQYYHIKNNYVYSCNGCTICKRPASSNKLNGIFIHHKIVEYILKNKKLFDKIAFYKNDEFLKLKAHYKNNMGSVDLYKPILKKDFQIDSLTFDESNLSININKKDFINELEFIKSAAGKKGLDIHFNLKNDKLKCISSDINEYSFNLDIETIFNEINKKEDLEFCININYLIDALKSKSFEEKYITIEYISPVSVVTIKDNIGNSNYILPIRKK